MLSKIVPAHSFYNTCRYICTKQGAEILLAEGVRGHSYKLMAEDFNRQQGMRPSKKRACVHGILSFYPGEHLSDKRMSEIANKYLQGLGLVNTQYAVCKHTDRANLHLHLIANLVNNKGKAISDSYLGLRGKKIAQVLTREYQLTPTGDKNLALTHLENLRGTEAAKYKIYMDISRVLAHCRSMEELEKRLLALGINTRYKYKEASTDKLGISFKIGNFCLKGSKVDRKFSLRNLQKTIFLNQGLVMGTVAEGGNAVTHTAPVKPTVSSQVSPGRSLEKHPAKGVAETLDSLLRPGASFESVPNELLKKKHTNKKKRSQSPRF